MCSLPWYIWWELIPNLISLWFSADLFWPKAWRIRGRSAQKWGYLSPVSQTMGLFAELFLFPSVRAATKAAEPWPECMWESIWRIEGEDGDDALWLEQRETQQWDAEAHISDTGCCLFVPHVTRQIDEGLVWRLPITEAAYLDKSAHPTGHTLQGMWECSQPPLTLAWMEDGAVDDMCKEWEAEWSTLVSHSTGARAHEHQTYNDKLSACIHHAFSLLLSPLKMQRERRRVGRIRKTEGINGLISLATQQWDIEHEQENVTERWKWSDNLPWPFLQTGSQAGCWSLS